LVPFHKKAGVQGLVRVEERKESSGAAGEGKGAGEGERAGAGEGMAPEDPEAPKVYQRYCHVYKEGELETLFDHLGSWVRVNRVYFDCGNWCVEAERIA
jgi:alkylated DNA repair protein alkB family protein 8